MVRRTSGSLRHRAARRVATRCGWSHRKSRGVGQCSSRPDHSSGHRLVRADDRRAARTGADRAVDERVAGLGRGVDRDEVGADVAHRGQPVTVEVAPHLPAEPARVELGDPGAVVGEDVDHRVGGDHLEAGSDVTGPEHTQTLARPDHARSLRQNPTSAFPGQQSLWTASVTACHLRARVGPAAPRRGTRAGPRPRAEAAGPGTTEPGKAATALPRRVEGPRQAGPRQRPTRPTPRPSPSVGTRSWRPSTTTRPRPRARAATRRSTSRSRRSASSRTSARSWRRTTWSCGWSRCATTPRRTPPARGRPHRPAPPRRPPRRTRRSRQEGEEAKPPPLPPSPSSIADALKTLTAQAPLATEQQGPGWEQARRRRAHRRRRRREGGQGPGLPLHREPRRTAPASLLLARIRTALAA